MKKRPAAPVRKQTSSRSAKPIGLDLGTSTVVAVRPNGKGVSASSFVLEGNAPYSVADEATMAALRYAALRGMPVARVGRRHHEGITLGNPNDLFIEGSNLTATKARLLLMACLMKFGSLPLPSGPEHPTDAELDAIRSRVASYQAVFDWH